MARTKLPRKEREKLQHREEIMAVALRLFSEKGFHSVSMQEIAEESEFAVGTLYNFFESKDSLSSAIMKACSEKIAAELSPTLEGSQDEIEKIIGFIRAHKKIIEDQADTIRLYLSQMSPSTLTLRPGLDAEATAMRDLIYQKLSSVIASGMKKGVFKTMDPMAVTFLLGAMLEAFIFRSIRSKDHVSIDQGLADIEDIFFHGSLSHSGA